MTLEAAALLYLRSVPLDALRATDARTRAQQAFLAALAPTGGTPAPSFEKALEWMLDSHRS